jgi:hypothetical protein
VKANRQLTEREREALRILVRAAIREHQRRVKDKAA